MKYNINESPKTIKEWLLYATQQMLSILTATILIASITGVDVSAGFVAAGVSTLVFLWITNFKAPLFFSLSGSTVAAVVAALELGGYVATIIGSITIFLMNSLFAFAIYKSGTAWINKLLPPIVSGSIVIVIGATLASFIPTYALVNGEYSLIGVAVAFITMVATTLFIRYAKGLWKNLPFLLGTLVGYAAALLLTVCGVADLVKLEPIKLINFPNFAFLNLNLASFDARLIPTIIVIFAAINLANVGEHIADIKSASSIVDKDLTIDPGLNKTMFGDGVADLVGSLICGNPTTTYSESLGTISTSKVASTKVIALAAIFTIILGFIGPINAIVRSIPSCVFAGVAMVCYGMIAASGLRVLKTVELTEKNFIIFAVILSIGLSGIKLSIGHLIIEKIALSMIVGLILNLIIKD